MLTTRKGTVSPLRIGKGPQVQRAGINTSSRIGSTEKERERKREERDIESQRDRKLSMVEGKKSLSAMSAVLSIIIPW